MHHEYGHNTGFDHSDYEFLQSGTTSDYIDKVWQRTYENVLRLRFLSPKIQKMILTGQQKIHWTNKLLFSIKSHNWREQERQLGIGDT